MPIIASDGQFMRQALEQAREGRLHILGKMEAVLAQPRADLSPFAPRLTSFKIPIDLIGALIGPGGKNIRAIVADSGAEINVDDDGTVVVAATSQESADKAIYAIKKIAEVMADADIGIIPKRNDGFGGEAFSTKTLEFMSLGVPIIVSKTKVDEFYFNETIVKFFEPGNENDLADAMILLAKDKKLRDSLAENALRFVQENQWEVRKHIYLDLVDSLVGTGRHEGAENPTGSRVTNST